MNYLRLHFTVPRAVVSLPFPGVTPAHSLPPFHQSDLVLDEEAVAEFPTGLWRFGRDEVNLFIPCVLKNVKTFGQIRVALFGMG